MDGKMRQISEANREVAWWVFRYYGLKLQEDNTVTTQGGRKVGQLNAADYSDGTFSLIYQSYVPMEYITTSITIKRTEGENGA